MLGVKLLKHMDELLLNDDFLHKRKNYYCINNLSPQVYRCFSITIMFFFIF